MNVLIVGAGKSGIYLAEKLRHNHQLTMIEQRPERADHLAAQVLGVRVVRGDGCEPNVLERAGASRADLVAALTGDDEDNLVISFLCKTAHGVPLVFARTNHPKNEWLFTRAWGVDVAVSAASVIQQLIETEVSLGEIVQLMKLRTGDLIMEEITLAEDAKAVGKTVADLELPAGARLVAIVSDGNAIVPQEDTVLGVGDELLVLTHSGTEDELRQTFGAEG